MSPKFTDDMNGRNIRLSIEPVSDKGDGKDYEEEEITHNFFNARGGKKETL